MMHKYFKSIFTLLFAMVATAAPVLAQSDGTLPKDFEKFLKAADAAQVEMQQGNAAAYKALWSHGEDVTLSGGFGGRVEKGWTMVSERLDWAASQFNKGTNTKERLSAYADGRLGYLVQLEHIKFKSPSGADSTRDFRVTMVFRKENGKWRIVHRHADGQTTKVGA
jgi:ketosteroid isomerase-like protein